MLFIAFHALAFIVMVDESTGCGALHRKCEDIIDKDGYWKVRYGSLSNGDNIRCCKRFTSSGGRDCKKKNEDRTTWRGKVEVKFFMNNLSLFIFIQYHFPSFQRFIIENLVMFS